MDTDQPVTDEARTLFSYLFLSLGVFTERVPTKLPEILLHGKFKFKGMF